MAKAKPPTVQIKAFSDHHVITQPNPLRNVVRYVDNDDEDDPVARAEQALAVVTQIGAGSDVIGFEPPHAVGNRSGVRNDGHVRQAGVNSGMANRRHRSGGLC